MNATSLSPVNRTFFTSAIGQRIGKFSNKIICVVTYSFNNKDFDEFVGLIFFHSKCPKLIAEQICEQTRHFVPLTLWRLQQSQTRIFLLSKFYQTLNSVFFRRSLKENNRSKKLSPYSKALSMLFRFKYDPFKAVVRTYGSRCRIEICSCAEVCADYRKVKLRVYGYLF